MNPSAPHDEPSAAPSGLDWLYQTQLFGIKLGLENMHRLLQALDLPAAGQKFLHVAGTNGKGSTCAFLHAVLKEAGLRAGLFTSPHLVRFNERIRDGEREIRDDEIEAGLARLRALVADWDPHPTFFELTLALALDWFRQRGVDWVVLETGLGGRLDATNALRPEVCVITRIGLDHQAQLGGTLAEIAAEKAGICKPGVPVVTGPQAPEARAVLEAAARAQGAPLTQVDEPLEGVELGLTGEHQAWNAALAVQALREAGLSQPALVLQEALRGVHWPARFQTLADGRVIVDGAHNADAADALARTWRQQFPGETATVVFGGSTGKDLAAVMQPLLAIGARWILTGFDSPRSVPAAELRAVWDRLPKEDATPVCDETPDLGSALALAERSSQRLLVTGSLFLAGEYLARREGAAHQPSAQ